MEGGEINVRVRMMVPGHFNRFAKQSRTGPTTETQVFSLAHTGTHTPFPRLECSTTLYSCCDRVNCTNNGDVLIEESRVCKGGKESLRS